MKSSAAHADAGQSGIPLRFMMRHATRTMVLVLATLMISADAATLTAQAPPSGDLLDSPCGLLSAAEVNEATGRRDYDAGEVLETRSEALEGGSSCIYGFPGEIPDTPADDLPPPIVLGLVASETGKSYTERVLRRGPRLGCNRETVSGIGEVAFVEGCATDLTLHAKVGTYDLQVVVGLEPPAKTPAVRAAALALAKTAAAKLHRSGR